tara:strand:- start:75813 stop:76799 length:987 start_codon:yes stop_codon:yes gene_type:complete
MKLFKKSLCALLVGAGVLAAGIASAEEARLRAVSAFTANTAFSRPFEAFVKKVNENGKGLVQIDIIGGPETMPPFELGNAVSKGIVDMANVPGAFYLSLMPAADALRLAEIPIAEQRENGAWEYINELHNKHMNVWYLARTADQQKYHLYLAGNPLEKPDLKGLTLRVSPTYRSFFEALGASLVQTPPGEVYTALERGVVQGYGWPLQGVLDLSWDEVTDYRVDPGFYTVDVNALVNLDSWNKLSQEQKAFLSKMAVEIEQELAANVDAQNAKEKAGQAEAGIKTITFSEADAKTWLETARRTGWEQVESQAPPEEAKRLKELLTVQE